MNPITLLIIPLDKKTGQYSVNPNIAQTVGMCKNLIPLWYPTIIRQ
jgi:hypothetical protein